MVFNKGQGEVEVRVRRPNAHRVFLAGDFNNWNKSTLAMTPTRNGDWVCRLKLPEGVYQFKYWVDGTWYLDNSSRAADPFPFGCHSLIVNDAGAPAAPVD
jgi:1,4-alpha-glucan branching enzyme